MPHEMTTKLFEEMANLRLRRTGATLDIVLEQINPRYPKDKYSAFAYGLWRIKELEEEHYKKLDEAIRSCQKKGKVKAQKEEKNGLFAQVTHQDLKSFGLIPEILGRLPILTYLDELDREAIKRILIEPKNALIKQYQLLFELDGVKLSFNKKAIDYIVDKAVERNLGARGLRGIMEDLMNKAMFDIPSDKTIKEFNVDLKYCKKYLD